MRRSAYTSAETPTTAPAVSEPLVARTTTTTPAMTDSRRSCSASIRQSAVVGGARWSLFTSPKFPSITALWEAGILVVAGISAFSMLSGVVINLSDVLSGRAGMVRLCQEGLVLRARFTLSPIGGRGRGGSTSPTCCVAPIGRAGRSRTRRWGISRICLMSWSSWFGRGCGASRSGCSRARLRSSGRCRPGMCRRR